MKIVITILLLMISCLALSDTRVRGYTKKDGTYVQPHYRSSPNNYKFDNYSSQGNRNPYTGQRGYDRNEFSTPPSYNYDRDANKSDNYIPGH